MSRSSDLRARFIEHCVVQGLFGDRKSVLAAVSGGADSIVLLHLLTGCAQALGIRVAAAHVNHMIRPEAAADAEFVRRAAISAGVPFVLAQVDVPAMAAAGGESLEAAGRAARYAELRRMAGQCGADAIATGHTMTDQAETVLMRMIRGTGPLGLSGIAVTTDEGLVRPMLCLTAAEVREFAASEGLSFVRDASNDDPYFLRNRIRAVILPLLREINPRIESRLSELSDDSTALAEMVAGLIGPWVTGAAEDRWLVGRDTPAALVPYAIRQAFRAVTGEPLGLSRTHIEALGRALRQDVAVAEFHLPRRVVVRLGPEGLMFTRDMDGPPPGSARKDMTA